MERSVVERRGVDNGFVGGLEVDCSLVGTLAEFWLDGVWPVAGLLVGVDMGLVGGQ